MKYDPSLVVPVEVIKAVQTIRAFATEYDAGDDWQIGGLTPVKYLSIEAPSWFKYDPQREIVEIHGIKYSHELFANLGYGFEVGCVLKIIERKDGVLTVTRLDTDQSA